MLPLNNTSHPICALFYIFVSFLLLFSPEMSDIFGGGAVGVFVKGDCCFPYLLFNEVYTHLHHLVVGHTFSPRQTMQERTTTTVNENGHAVAIAL